MIKKIYFKNFPAGPVTKISHFHCRGASSVPLWEAKIPRATHHSKKIKVSCYF